MVPGYFPGDDIQIPPELVGRLAKFSERKTLLLRLDCDANIYYEV